MRKLFLLLIAVALFTMTGAQTNLITNGSFENDFWPSRQPGSKVFARSVDYAEPARVAQYFNEKTEAYWPKITDATPSPVFDTESGIWYLRNIINYNYVRLYVDTLKPNTPDGSRCLTFHNTKYSGTNTPARNVSANTPYSHTAFQRVSLNNSKKYDLSFSYMKMDSLLGTASGTTNLRTDNFATRFVAGIVSSTDPTSPLDFTYVVDIPIPVTGDESWKDTTILLDLPLLIEANEILDFSTSAIIFGLQTKTDPESTVTYTMLPGQMSIDNIVLKEASTVDVLPVNKSINFRVQNKTLIVNDVIKSVQVYDLLGNLLHQNMKVSNNEVYKFKTTGTYLVRLDDKAAKVIVY